jgi:hypothetical protein
MRCGSRTTVFLPLCFVGFILFAVRAVNAQSNLDRPAASFEASTVNLQLPVAFELNRGQAASDVIAIARTAMGVAAFRRDEMLLPLPAGQLPLHVIFGNRSAASIVPESPSGGVVNYLNNSDRSKWIQGLPLYRGIRYKSISDGVDLVLHGTLGRLECDFDLSPRANASSARLEIEDPATLNLQSDGSLLITPSLGGSLRLDAPYAFQVRNDSRVPVDVSFQIHDRTISFKLGAYDPELPLVIDPVVAYTTLIGVNSNISVDGLGVDSSGNAIFAGSTNARNWPVVNGSQPNSSGSQQVYITKLDPSGTNILFSTYIPATGFNKATRLVVDAKDNIYVSGIAQDPAFPVTSQNLGSCSQFCNTGFVVKLDPTGKVVYSTLIGSGQQIPRTLAVNPTGELLVAGSSADAGLVTVNAYYPDYSGALCTNCSSGFFGKLNANGTNWVFSSYFPILPTLSFNQQSGFAIQASAIDSTGNFYIGGTGAPFTLVRPLFIPGSNVDPGYAFIAKFSPDGQKLLFSTDLPALSIKGLKAGADGTLFVAGNATADFPYSLNSLTSPFSPLWAAQDSNLMFAAALSPAQDSLVYATYLGHGFVNDTSLGTDGNFYIAGSFNLNAPLPLKNALETDVSTGGFVLSLTPSGQLASSTPIGGHFEQQVPTGLAVDSGGNIFLGSAPGSSGTLSNDPLDPVNVGTGTAYSSQSSLGMSTTFIGYAASIVKISPSNLPQISLSYIGPYLVLRNAGSADLHISSISYGGGFQKSWGNCASTIPAGSSCFLVPGTNAGDTASGTITINSDAQPSQQTFTPGNAPTGLGQKIAPFIYVADVPLIFPPQIVGSTSAAQTLQLTNLGATTTSVTVNANGSATNSLQVNSNCGSLAPGATCSAQIAYAPNAGSSIGGSLVINSSGPISNSFPFAHAGGLNTTDPLQFSTSLLSFGTVVMGQQSLPHPVTLTNATSAAITVPSPVINNPDFTVFSNSCSSPLLPAQTCAIAIVYSPSAAGAQVFATVTLAGNSTQLNLNGTPMASPAVSATPTSLSFGPLASTGSQSKVVTLSNTGSAAVPVNSILTSSQSFNESDNCNGNLVGQQSCAINVSFIPGGQVGTFSGKLWISLNGGPVTLPIALSGISTTNLTASPSSLDFGSTTVAGTTSAPQSITITNPTAVSQPISPSFSGPFAVSSNGCPASLAAPLSCTMSVDFAPTQAGIQQGTMTLSFTDGSAPLVIQLTGKAVAPTPIAAVSPQAGGSTSATVSSGQTATYKLTITASSLFSGTVNLTCAGAPVHSTCSISPTSVSLTPGGQANITVSVATGVTSSAAMNSRSIILGGIGLGSIFPLMILISNRRRLSDSFGIFALLALCANVGFGLVACGGGGGGTSSSGGNPNATPMGTYTLVLTATSGSQTVTQPLTLTVR